VKAGDTRAALVAARADTTQYLIYHRANTVPAVRSGLPLAAEWFDIDFDFMAEQVKDLIQCYWINGETRESRQVLERLRGAIDSPRWQRRITRYLADVEAGPNADPVAARKELEKLYPVTAEETDVGVLQLMLQLNGATISFSQTTMLCDHILRLDDSPAADLQYSMVRAIQYLLIDDVQRAGADLEALVARARLRAEDGDFSPYEVWLFATAVGHLGFLRREGTLVDEALGLLVNQLIREGWKTAGRARLHVQIADLQRRSGRWAAAAAAYETAISLSDSSTARIFLAESLAQLGRTEEARVELNRIVPEGLDMNEYEDFVFTLASLASLSGDRNDLQRAAGRLGGFTGSSPFFERRRMAVLIRINQIIATGRTPKIQRSLGRWLAVGVRSFSRYTILEPNINGIGLNGNQILNDIADRLDTRTEDSKR